MKKTFLFILILALVLSFCACGSDRKDKYENVGLYGDEEYKLSDNMTFRSSDSLKGTYVVESDGTIWFKPENTYEFNFTKVGDYYYKEDIYGGFSEDTSEKLNEVIFNEKGRTDQSFYKGVEKTYYGLDLNDDGTYSASIEKFNDDYSLISKEEFEGTYSLKGNILWLKHGKSKYPMIYDNGVLHYNVIQEVEEK